MESLPLVILVLIALSLLLLAVALYCLTPKNLSEEVKDKVDTSKTTPKTDTSTLKENAEDKLIESSKLFDMFCEYVKQNRVIYIDQYAKKLNTTREKAVQQLREMENESELMGFLNNDEYFYLTLKEIDLLDNLTKKRNKVYTEAEINSLFKEIVTQGK